MGRSKMTSGFHETTRFPIRFDPFYRWVSTALFLLPSDSYLDVNDHDIHVRMGWAFRATIKRSTLVSVAQADRRPLSRGVHGIFGRWLVNGSGDGIVRLNLEPRQRAWVLGFPISLGELFVSLEDPGALVEQLR